MRNYEIKAGGDVPGLFGRVDQAGFSRKPCLHYNRDNLKAPRFRVKEWNYLLVTTPRYALAFTISDLGYARMGSATVIDLKTGFQETKTSMAAPSVAWTMPDEVSSGKAVFHARDFYIAEEVLEDRRLLRCLIRNFHNGQDLQAYITIDTLPDESMTIVIPWKDSDCFYYNTKINAMRVSGIFMYDGQRHQIRRRESLATLDWGRGVWPYHTHWYWATGNDFVDGIPVGLNLGYGFGDTSAASENAIIYDGKLHKLDDVEFVRPADPMEPWIITSSDGRFEGIFKPRIDRAAMMNYGVIASDQHQYFGTFTGKAVLDDGTVLPLQDFQMALEDIRHRW